MPANLVLSIDGRRVDSFADMQRIVGTSAGQTLQVEVDRGGRVVSLSAIPALKEIKDNFGNMHRIGVLGITRSMAPGDVRFEKSGPITLWKHFKCSRYLSGLFQIFSNS